MITLELVHVGSSWQKHSITNPAQTLKGEHGANDDDDDEENDPEALAAEEAASKERKRAGLPELTPDSLNSAVANKMMSLSPK